MNRVILNGNLVAKPELRFTATGKAVANFSMATNERWIDKEGKKVSRPTFHRVVVWGKVAENVAAYCNKGRAVLVEGRIKNRTWKDKEGNTRYTTEIVSNSVQFLGAAPKADENAAQEPQVDDDPQMDIPNFESEF